jgi:hypothetical protein
MALTVTISAALLMGAGVYVLCRYAGLRVWHAAVCIIFGFYLASSSLAPDITNVMTSLFRLL